LTLPVVSTKPNVSLWYKTSHQTYQHLWIDFDYKKQTEIHHIKICQYLDYLLLSASVFADVLGVVNITSATVIDYNYN